MKILHVISDSNIGGAGKLLFNISRCIDRNNFEFVFVFVKNSNLIKLFKPLGFKIYTIDCVPDRSFDIKSVRIISAIIKKEKPQILHTHSSLAGKIALKLSRVSDIKSIYTKHCVFGVPKYMRSPIARKLYRLADNFLSDLIIAVADAAKKELINFGIQNSKIRVIINGSRKLKVMSEREKEITKEQLGIKNGEFIVGISARLEKYKGHKYFLEAAQIAKINNEKIKFIIMGDGSYRAELKKYAQKLGVDDRVIFLGFINNIEKYVNIFDVNVNCSVGTETSSLSVSEGLSLGKPAIVSNFGGNPNMVINGITGCVIDRADSNALYKAILKLKNDSQTYKKMSMSAAKDFEKRFSDDTMTKKYEKIYKDLISNNIYRD